MENLMTFQWPKTDLSVISNRNENSFSCNKEQSASSLWFSLKPIIFIALLVSYAMSGEIVLSIKIQTPPQQLGSSRQQVLFGDWNVFHKSEFSSQHGSAAFENKAFAKTLKSVI